MSSVSAVIPVKDGARYLGELLSALRREGVPEVLVIDSGSRDGSLAIARAAGVRVLEIAPESFGHGRTRNLGAEETSGELIAFLTQDATPRAGWLGAYEAAFRLDRRVGAAYGPHLPRKGTSPMIARELTEFFAGFSPQAVPVLQHAGDATFLSNVNACYSRPCWEEIRFRDIDYAEDQAFGRDMLARGWLKVYHPQAAVLHAHDYGAWEFNRRYFDEYRGLRASIGHVEPLGFRSAREVRSLLGGDWRWMKAHGYSTAERYRWLGRASAHHGGRKLFSALGSRAGSLPPGLRRRLSFEGSDYAPVAQTDAAAGAGGAEQVAGGAGQLPLTPQSPRIKAHEYEPIARVLRDGPAPLAQAVSGMAERKQLHVAFVVPPFSKGSGGHNIIFQLMHRLEQRGHTCSVWFEDLFRMRSNEWPARLRAEAREYFAPINGPLHKDFARWYGADVVVATAWQTAYLALALPNVRARAYLINDHEPEFYATSIERRWAEASYRQGLYGICGSPWLRELYVNHYGGEGEVFDYGVDHAVYHPRKLARRRETVVYYCRSATPRRAVALGILALHRLYQRRPGLRIVMFGERDPLPAPFPYEQLGVASPDQLAVLFSEATVGLSLSMTNYSLIPQEMLACGLPCVDLQGASAESVFGADGPVELSPFDDEALAGHLERMLDDEELWQRRSRRGIEFVAGRSWDRATEQVEHALRNALHRREDASMELPGAATIAAR